MRGKETITISNICVVDGCSDSLSDSPPEVDDADDRTPTNTQDVDMAKDVDKAVAPLGKKKVAGRRK